MPKPAYVSVFDVPCPKCGAKPGQHCRRRNRVARRYGSYTHRPRQKAADELRGQRHA